MKKSKQVLVTGGAGLIGSHLINRLLDKGHKVTCVDNFITGRRENIAHLGINKNFTLVKADASHPPKSYLNHQLLIINHFHYIFHLASPASPLDYLKNPIATYKVNSFGTHYLLELAKKHKARFLFASTSEIYGDPKVHPQPETYWGSVNPNGIRSCYDESKRFGEMVCKTFERKYDLDVRIARIFNTYGPRNDPEDGRVVPNLIVQAIQDKPMTIYGDGKQTRSFCYVADLIDGLLSLMFKPKLKGKVVNLGNPEEFTVLELANKIKSITKSNSKIVFSDMPEDDPNRRKPDITKAKKLLRWQPKVSLDQGLPATIKYFKQVLKNKK